jgi:hypothetical protein
VRPFCRPQATEARAIFFNPMGDLYVNTRSIARHVTSRVGTGSSSVPPPPGVQPNSAQRVRRQMPMPDWEVVLT